MLQYSYDMLNIFLYIYLYVDVSHWRTEDVFEEEIEIGNADDEEDDEEDYAIEYEYEEGKTSFGYPLPCSHHNNIYSHNTS